MKTLVLALPIVALASVAQAGITCNLTDTQGNALQYSFAHGGHGYTNEVSVKRNGAVVSNGGPSWNRSFDPRAKTMELAQAGWSLVYEAKPRDTDISGAALFPPGSRKPTATGTCMADYSTDAPQSSPEPEPAPSAPVEVDNGNGDTVPLIVTARNQAFVTVRFGGWKADMQIDTGANVMTMGPALADNLVRNGLAHWAGRTSHSEMANGSVSTEDVLMVDRVMVGGHTIVDVPAAVSPGSSLLLPFQILLQTGRVTLDLNTRQLIFG